MQLFSYQIAGIFLLAALLMYGTIGGFAPRLLRDSRTLLMVAGAILVVFGLWKLSPQLSFDFLKSDSPVPAVSAPRPAATVPTPRRLAPKPESHRARVVVIQEVPRDPLPRPTDEPAESSGAIDVQRQERSGPDPYESGVKRGAKAVGRFLHVIPRR